MSLWTVGRYFISQITWMAKLQGSGSASVWETLGIYEKFRFLDLWVLFTIIGNLFQMFGGILMLFEHVVVVNTLDAIIGLGCYFAWIGSLRFLNKTSQEATMTNTVNRSFGIIGPYIIGAVPIFMAYVFFAMCSFWETGLYPNTHMGMIAAFAVVNGDSVYAFGFAEYSQSAFIGMLFYFTFVVFFIWYALYSFVQNVFIAIIQVGYRSLQTEPPRQGDESSDEESPVPQELIIKKRKSPRNS